MNAHKPSRLSQDQMILMHLQSGEPITAAQAVAEYGCYRLASVINRLRKEHSIFSHTETSTNRFGVKVRFARYRLALPKRELKPAADLFIERAAP